MNQDLSDESDKPPMATTATQIPQKLGNFKDSKVKLPGPRSSVRLVANDQDDWLSIADAKRRRWDAWVEKGNRKSEVDPEGQTVEVPTRTEGREPNLESGDIVPEDSDVER